jgi:hypothetical protein
MMRPFPADPGTTVTVLATCALSTPCPTAESGVAERVKLVAISLSAPLGGWREGVFVSLTIRG